MATAKKLPSGSWRCLVYSHSETIFDASGDIVYGEDGKPKKKRIYESFTSDDPSPQGKKEAEFLAAQFALKKKRDSRPANLTLREAIDQYIDNSDAVLSPTTIEGYRTIQRNAFAELMDIPLSKITNQKLKEAVNNEAKRPAKRGKGSTTISAKTVCNEYGLSLIHI